MAATSVQTLLLLALACLVIEGSSKPHQAASQQRQRSDSEKIKELVRAAAESKPTVPKPSVKSPESKPAARPAKPAATPKATASDSKTKVKDAKPKQVSKGTAPAKAVKETKPAPVAPVKVPAKPVKRTKPKPAAPKSTDSVTKTKQPKPVPAKPVKVPAKPVKRTEPKPKPDAPTPKSTPKPRDSQSQAAGQSFQQVSTVALAALEKVQKQLSASSTQEKLWGTGLVAAVFYHAAPSAAAAVLLGVSAGPVLLEHDPMATLNAWWVQAEEHQLAAYCVFGTIGFVLFCSYFQAVSTAAVLAVCSWRVGALLSRLLIATLEISDGPVTELLVHKSTLELLHSALDQRTALLVGVLVGLATLKTRHKLLQMLPGSGVAGLLARIVTSLVVVATLTVAQQRVRQTTVHLDAIGLLVLLWLWFDLAQGVASKVQRPHSTSSALPLQTVLTAVAVNLSCWLLQCTRHMDALLLIVPSETRNSLGDMIGQHNLPTEQTVLGLGLLSSCLVVHSCLISADGPSVVRRFSVCTAFSALLQCLVEQLNGWAPAADLIWLALLMLPVQEASNLSAASSFERQEQWSSKVRHMDASTRQETLGRPLGGLDPQVLRDMGWHTQPVPQSPAQHSASLLQHSPSPVLHRRQDTRTQPSPRSHQRPLPQIVPPAPGFTRGSFQSPVLPTRPDSPFTQPQPVPMQNPTSALRAPARQSPLKREAPGIGESPSKKMRAEAGRPRKRKGEE